MSLENQIRNWMQGKEDELVTALAPLIAAESTLGEAKPGMPFGEGLAKVLEEALALAKAWGFRTENIDGYVGTADLSNCPDGLHVLAHLDVVGAGTGWDTPPYSLIRQGDLIFGRGVDDDKGPLVAVLLAMRCIRELGVPLSKNVKLIMGTDEETGSRDLAYYYASHPYAPYALSPDSVFPVTNVEKACYAPNFSKKWLATASSISINGGIRKNVAPSNCSAEGIPCDRETLTKAIQTAREKTGVSFECIQMDDSWKISAMGKATHASTPNEGNNAITAMLELLSMLPLPEGSEKETIVSLHRLFPHGDHHGQALGIAMEDDVAGKTTVTLSLLHMDNQGFEAQFDARLSLAATEENTTQAVYTQFSTLGWDCHGTFHPAHVVDGDSDFIRTLVSCYETFSGNVGYCESMGGSTYVHNVPGGVAFGAGEHGFDSHLHGPNERARISQLLKTSEIYAAAIAALCR